MKDKVEVTVVDHNQKVMELTNTVATRKYPFTQLTLDQIQDIRKAKEDQIYDETGNNVLVPAPIVIAEAIDHLHEEMFKA